MCSLLPDRMHSRVHRRGASSSRSISMSLALACRGCTVRAVRRLCTVFVIYFCTQTGCLYSRACACASVRVASTPDGDRMHANIHTHTRWYILVRIFSFTYPAAKCVVPHIVCACVSHVRGDDQFVSFARVHYLLHFL